MKKTYCNLLIALFLAFNSFGQSAWTTYNTSNSGISGNTIGSIKIDSKDNKWFFTWDNNNNFNNCVLTKFDGTNWTNYSNPPSCGPFTIDSQDNIWVGTDKLYKFDGINWTTYNPTMTLSQDGQIKSVAADKQGNIWVGTFENGLFKFDGINWIKKKDGGLGNIVNSIAFDANENLWICQGQMGVSKFDGTNWTTYNSSNSGINLDWAMFIAIDKQDNKWVYNAVGNSILKFDGTNWTTYNSTNCKILRGNISSFSTDNQNNLWVAIDGFESEGGLSKFNGASWINYTLINSNIVSCAISSIAIDSKGDKWIGSSTIPLQETGRGISKLTGLGNSNLCDNIPDDNNPYTSNYITFINSGRCSGNSFGTLYSLDKSASNTYTWKDANNNLLTDKNIDSLMVKMSGKYTLKVEDSICFRSDEIAFVITDTFPAIKDLCMVTNQNGHNLLLWDNTDNNYVTKYRIYKENHNTSKYDLVFEQSKKEMSEWLDTLSSNQVERYKLAVVDSCGNESEQSVHHTTILLSSNIGLNGTVNLAWNPYQGFDYQNFEIWRSTDGVNYNLLSSVANQTYAYIDNNPPSNGYYQVRITKSDGCNPTKRAISAVKSNIISKDGKPLGIKTIEKGHVTIYPNPTKGIITLNSSVSMLGKSFDIIDIVGRVIYSSTINTISQVIDIESFDKGTYFLKSMDNISLKLLKQ